MLSLFSFLSGFVEPVTRLRQRRLFDSGARRLRRRLRRLVFLHDKTLTFFHPVPDPDPDFSVYVSLTWWFVFETIEPRILYTIEIL